MGLAVAQPRSALLRAPREVHFGAGLIARLPAVVCSLGDDVLVCAGPSVLALPAVVSALGQIEAEARSLRVCDFVAPDLPVDRVERAQAFAREAEVDVVVGIGGGSTIDLAKLSALGLTTDDPLSAFYGENLVPGPTVPVVAVPTTAGTGSEATPVAVVHDPSRTLKVGISSPYLIPDVALCDPLLTVTCPPTLTAHTGIDALIHAVEAFTARVREPVDPAAHPGDVFRGKGFFSDVLTYRAIEKIGGALERAVRNGDDVAARSDLALGSLCAGLGFGTAGTAAIHALQYPFGAATGTPHGLGIGLLAPYVLAYIRPACVSELAQVARALGVGADDDELASERAVREIARLVESIGIPRTLRAAGVAREQLRAFAEDAASIERLMRNSPRPLDVDALEAILEHAWTGEL